MEPWRLWRLRFERRIISLSVDLSFEVPVLRVGRVKSAITRGTLDASAPEDVC